MHTGYSEEAYPQCVSWDELIDHTVYMDVVYLSIYLYMSWNGNENDLSHYVHWRSYSPVCVLRCIARSHCMHWYGFSLYMSWNDLWDFYHCMIEFQYDICKKSCHNGCIDIVWSLDGL